MLGCSTIATLDGAKGYHDMSTVLMALTADDCTFAAAMTNPLTGADGVPCVRAVNRINPADGSALIYADVPQGSTVSLAVLPREDIAQSVESGIATLRERMEACGGDDYEYSTVLCISELRPTSVRDGRATTTSATLPSLSARFSFFVIVVIHRGKFPDCALLA